MQTTSIVPSEDFAVISGQGEGGVRKEKKNLSKRCVIVLSKLYGVSSKHKRGP